MGSALQSEILLAVKPGNYGIAKTADASAASVTQTSAAIMVVTK